ncbi:peptide chain release factor N(5)-glutamine methyltransferase [Haliangium sp.]|uniref:peptide chain release factor N(5)-glutamine methyltransferase n=1 Tax=Haliangium sp. TaxID=2663208 RepID=UPI003D0A8D60
MSESWTILKVLEWTTGRFQRAGLEPARLEAQVLLAHVLGCDRVRLYVDFERPLQAAELARYRGLIQRRLAGEPAAYLIGEQEFWSLPFTVGPEVLVPRRDTETVIEVILDQVSERGAPVRVADVATGSGAIAVTLAHELRAAQVVATDASAAAARLAAANAARNRVDDRVEVRVGDLLLPLAADASGHRGDGRGAGTSPGAGPDGCGDDPGFDILVSNLPYVPSADIPGLAAEVRHEPAMALDGGPDGLVLIRRLVAEAARHLRPAGLLVLEHGYDQAEAVRGLIAATGAFEAAQTRADLGGQPRVTWARRLA